MRILVAGGQGQVGSEFEQLDLPNDLEVICLGRSELDIVNVDSIDRAFATHQPDLFFNAAAYTAVDKAESEQDRAFEINELAVGLLADACGAAQIPMFHVSTDYVFDGEKADAYMESDPVNPVSIYGKSKEAGERVLRDRLERHLILRTSWIFGVNGANFVKTILRLACERDQLSVVNDQIGGPTSARSIASCMIELARLYNDDGDLSWGTYHFSQLPSVSWYEFAVEIIDRAIELNVLNRRVVVTPVSSSEFPTKAARPKNSRLCVEKINQHISSNALSGWRDDISSVLINLNALKGS